jgi:hypothetical protein
VVLQAVPRFRDVLDPFLIEFAAVALVLVAQQALRRRPLSAMSVSASSPLPSAAD